MGAIRIPFSPFTLHFSRLPSPHHRERVLQHRGEGLEEPGPGGAVDHPVVAGHREPHAAPHGHLAVERCGPRRDPPGPVVIWNLIRRCNLTCRHCYSISGDVDFPGELSTDEVFRVMDDLEAAGVRVLILSGGEPLMRRDIFEISRRAKQKGLYVGLSYAYLLVMVFPLYNAIESLDKNQIEAARDLGASWWRIHKDVVIPYAKPGIASGCTMVFMLSAGSLAAPQFLGGPNTLWFTSIVYDFFFQAFNWPRGAAYAFLLLAGCIALVMLMLRLFKVTLGETIR